jgi:hypothetical protein
MSLHSKQGRTARIVWTALTIWAVAVVSGFLLGQFLVLLGYEWVRWE